jgi:hypothetical protein
MSGSFVRWWINGLQGRLNNDLMIMSLPRPVVLHFVIQMWAAEPSGALCLCSRFYHLISPQCMSWRRAWVEAAA